MIIPIKQLRQNRRHKLRPTLSKRKWVVSVSYISASSVRFRQMPQLGWAVSIALRLTEKLTNRKGKSSIRALNATNNRRSIINKKPRRTMSDCTRSLRIAWHPLITIRCQRDWQPPRWEVDIAKTRRSRLSRKYSQTSRRIMVGLCEVRQALIQFC